MTTHLIFLSCIIRDRVHRAADMHRKGYIMYQENIRLPQQGERRAYIVEEIAAILGIGRTSAYKLVKEGNFKTVRIGNAIRISKKSFDEWLDSQNN